MTKNLYIKTFGCQMNERDSEIIAQMLAAEGYVSVDQPEAADVLLVNTCSIREKAEQKVFSLLGHYRDLKHRKPSLLLGVAGCVAQQEGERIQERMPHVDLIIGTQHIHDLPEMLARLRAGASRREKALSLDADFAIPPLQRWIPRSPALSRHIKRFVTIMQGCNNFCSYCVVPFTRGREISRPLADILEEVQILVEQGVREITLLGQNVNSYGMGNTVAENTNFPQLLRHVAAIPGLRRLRFTTSNPKDLSPELIACFGELENLCPHFHLPVQSGANAVLRRMNRKYTVEEYLEKVAALREACPAIALSTDIIVGFPGESEADFQATLALLRTVRFHASFSFKYSDRPNARSTAFPDKVAEEVKAARLAAFQALQDDISLERNSEYLGQLLEVMVEETDAAACKGRTASNHVVHFLSNMQGCPVPGDFVQVRIRHAGRHALKGTLQETDELSQGTNQYDD